MKTGFYNLDKLNTRELRKFYKESIKLAYQVMCESKYTEHNKWRGYSRKYSIEEYMKMVSKKNHNVCIDRSIQHPNMIDCEHGEIGFKLHHKFDFDWHQITINVSLSNLKKLIEDFGLEEIDN